MISIDVIAPIPALLAKHGSERADETAFRDLRREITYADLDARTARLAAHLRDLGLADQHRLLMYLDNAIEVVEGFLAAPRAGIVSVSTNPTATRPELAYIAQNSQARIILTDRAHLDAALDAARHATELELVILTGSDVPPMSARPGDDIRILGYDELMDTEPQTSAPDSTQVDAWSWMLYTSGTTGRPKGVRLSQRGCLWVVAACWIPIAGLNAGDHLLSCLPLFHSYALVLCVAGVAAAGATATLLPKFSPRDVSARLADEGVTVFPGVPTMFQYLLNSRPAGTTLSSPSLRLCISAGAIMSSSLNEEFERYAGVPLLDGYGITETSTMVTMNSPTGGRVPGSCGVPLPGVALRFVGRDGLDVHPGAEGELWVQGPNVMQGYHELPEATAAALSDGWYRTGDLGHRDANGFVTITGRVKELIIRAGENISPAEIEEVIFTCPGVADAAVVGAPHPDLGEVPVAFVVAAEGQQLDHENILATCRANLAYFKVPDRIVEAREIPRTGSGKIRRFELQVDSRSARASLSAG